LRLDKKKLGLLGEQTAVEYLEEKGYSVLERNYTSKLGEVDIIVAKDEDICFVEVKARTRKDYGTPQEAVNQTKQQKIVKTALTYLKAKGYLKYNCRFDIISILMDKNNNSHKINHIENAFSPADYYTF